MSDSYDPSEQGEILDLFREMLAAVIADGGRKRNRGEKPSWKVDLSHEAAIFSHLNRWKHGEKEDPDSGQHPLVHLACRALMIAWQEGHPSPMGLSDSTCTRSDAPAVVKEWYDYHLEGLLEKAEEVWGK